MPEWNHNGIGITIDGTGKFNAQVDDAWVHAETLAAVKEKIDRSRRALSQVNSVSYPVLVLIEKNSDYEVAAVKLIGYNRTTGGLRFDPPCGEPVQGWVVPDTPWMRTRMELFAEHFSHVMRIRDQLNACQIPSFYGRISVEAYNNLLEKLSMNYARRSELAIEREQAYREQP